MPGVRADLERLVRIPGIAFDGFDHSHVERSAEAVAELLRGCGLDTRIVRSGGQPAVIGRKPAPAGRAHRAALRPPRRAARRRPQPLGERARSSRSSATAGSTAAAPPTTRPGSWRTSPRCAPSATTCRSAWSLFIEGEEEYGSDSLERLLAEHRDEIAADVIVIADSGNWDIGVPALTTSLRGIVNCFVEVRTLEHAVHSGMFGGAVPGRADHPRQAARHPARRRRRRRRRRARRPRPAPNVDYPEDRFRAEAGLADGVSLHRHRAAHRPDLDQAGPGGARHRRPDHRRGAERPACRPPRPSSASGWRPATTPTTRVRGARARTWRSTRPGARR